MSWGKLKRLCYIGHSHIEHNINILCLKWELSTSLGMTLRALWCDFQAYQGNWSPRVRLWGSRPLQNCIVTSLQPSPVPPFQGNYFNGKFAYVGIYGKISSTVIIKEMKEVRDVRYRCKQDLYFCRIWIIRAMAWYSFLSSLDLISTNLI